MRGAGLRLNIDVRRAWHCSVCGAERKVGAQVTTVRCQCEGRPAMKLVETQRQERPLKELASPYLEFVFEPGELAPPRSQVEEVQAQPGNERPEDAEISAAMESEANEGGPALPERSGQRPAQQQRSSRREDRRGGNGPEPARGPQGRKESGPRRDQSPQRTQLPRRDQQPQRRDDRPTAPPLPPADQSGFGEGIHDDHSPE